MKPINRTTTLIYKKGRRVKVEKHVKRIYYPDHNNPKVLKPIITEPKDAKVYYTGYKHEIIDHDLLIGFSPKYNDLPFLRFTDPKTENTWALWIKGFGKNIPKTGIRPKSIGKLKYGMHYEIDPNIELKFEVLGHMIRKVIIVHKRPEWNEITFIISRFGGHLITGKTFGKSEPLLAFRKNDIKPLFKFLRPTVYDSSEPLKHHKPLLFLNNIRTGVWELKIKLSEKWLDEAKYPIYIDPTLELQPDADEGYDNFIANDNPGTAEYLNIGAFIALQLRVTDTEEIKNVLIKFDLSDIPQNSTIISSILSLYMYSNHGDITIRKYRILRDWGEGNKDIAEATEGESSWAWYARPNEWSTWGAQSIGEDIAEADDDDTTILYSQGVNIWVDFDVTASTQQIINTGINYGWKLGGVNAPSLKYVRFKASDWDMHPKITVEYTLPDNIYWKIGRVGWEGQGRPFKWIF